MAYETNMYEGMIAETVSMTGANGDFINAYMARPLLGLDLLALLRYYSGCLDQRSVAAGRSVYGVATRVRTLCGGGTHFYPDAARDALLPNA